MCTPKLQALFIHRLKPEVEFFIEVCTSASSCVHKYQSICASEGRGERGLAIYEEICLYADGKIVHTVLIFLYFVMLLSETLLVVCTV
jgi:hypothetical protein